jgi:hypothetical protein
MFTGPFLAATNSSGTSNLFFYSLIFIFVIGVITTVVTKWTKDKCLKFFDHFHVTLERTRGQVSWGNLRVFSSGLEIVFDHPYVDLRGHKKTSFLLYQADIDAHLLSIFRYHNEMNASDQQRRAAQVHRTFNPGAIRRFFRKIRNFINTLRDAFGAALGAAVGQYQKMNPTSTLSSDSGQVTQFSQSLLDKFGNAYEPLLEQYIGQPVILEILDPADPNNVVNEFTGYLADYTQNYLAVFNAQHAVGAKMELMLPDVEQGDPMPAAPAVPAAGVPANLPPPPLLEENGLAVYIDGLRLKICNRRTDAVVARHLLREGVEALNLGITLAPNAVLDFAAKDVHGATIVFEQVQCFDIVSPRKFAIIHHAGVLLPRPTLVDDLSVKVF